MYRKCSQGWIKHMDFIMLDLVCLNLSFLLAYIIRHGFEIPYTHVTYRNMAFILSFIAVLLMIFFEMFKNVLKRGYLAEAVMTLKQVCMVELCAVFYLFAVREGGAYSRTVMYLTGLIYGVTGYITRVLWKSFLKRKVKRPGKRTLLILTSENMAPAVLENIKSHNYENFHILGVALLDGDRARRQIGGVPVVVGRENVLDYVRRESVDEVFVDLPEGQEQPTELLEHFSEMGLVVHVKLLDGEPSMPRKQSVGRLGNYTVMTTGINYITNRQLFLKRTLDIAGGLIGSLFTLLLALFLGPIIKLKSPGSLFFVQERVGKNGRRFRMYKFRSMYADAEERKAELAVQNQVKDGFMFKMERDPRIIGSRQLPDGTYKKGIGNFLRDWSLDEFPQFFNVLKGDMSLIGTRPPTVEEWEKYEFRHMARLAAKPGITGLWQISGRSSITDFEEVVKLDLQYISEWSFAMDLKILMKTVKVVLGRNGAM